MFLGENVLKSKLNTFSHTQNAPKTSRESTRCRGVIIYLTVVLPKFIGLIDLVDSKQ